MLSLVEVELHPRRSCLQHDNRPGSTPIPAMVVSLNKTRTVKHLRRFDFWFFGCNPSWRNCSGLYCFCLVHIWMLHTMFNVRTCSQQVLFAQTLKNSSDTVSLTTFCLIGKPLTIGGWILLHQVCLVDQIRPNSFSESLFADSTSCLCNLMMFQSWKMLWWCSCLSQRLRVLLPTWAPTPLCTNCQTW